MNSILQQLNDEFRGEALHRYASSMGETPGKVQIALDAALPAMLTGLAQKASTADGATELLDVMRKYNLDGQESVARGLASGFTSRIATGKPFVDFIFGKRATLVTDWVAAYAGIGPSSSLSLLSLVAPIALGIIARQIGQADWNTAKLRKVLGETDTWLDAAPAGLSSVLGVPALVDAQQPVTRPYREVQSKAPWTLWKWAVPLLVLGAVGYFALRGMQPPRREVVITTGSSVEATSLPPAPTVRPDLGSFVVKVLPSGATLHIPSNGVESKLLAFIADPHMKVYKETWFTFDRLQFDSNSATLEPSSDEQLRNIAEILKAYPKVNVKIGGYTDNVGDDAYNLKLSQDRAINTMTEIAGMGVDSRRLAAEGYGENYPASDNITADGRQRNRRIDIRVTKK